MAWADEATFAAFYERTARALWAYVFRSTGNRADADDIVQDAFCRLATADVAALDDDERRRYVFRIAANLMTDRWRQASRERAALDRAEGETAVTVPAPGGGEDMARTFAALNPRERSLLWLAYVEGHDHKSIAAAVGVAPASVRVLLSRARARLRDVLRGGVGS